MADIGLGLGFLIGRSALVNFKFDPQYPYAACRICGEAFQSDKNRLGSQEGLLEWRINHNKLHADREHVQLIKSGRKFTPDAAHKLAALGIIDFDAILADPEMASAYAEAPRAPVNDVEGS
jgi:hypothetical protein